MDMFSETSPTTPPVVDQNGVIEFAPPKKRMLSTNEDCGIFDAIVQTVKKIVKIEK